MSLRDIIVSDQLHTSLFSAVEENKIHIMGHERAERLDFLNVWYSFGTTASVPWRISAASMHSLRNTNYDGVEYLFHPPHLPHQLACAVP